MVETKTDVNNGGPSVTAAGPLEPVSSQLEPIIGFLNLRFDKPQDFLQNLMEAVLELPPKERFTKSGLEVVKSRFKDEFGSIDAAQALFPDVEPEKLIQVLIDLTSSLRSDILGRVFQVRNVDEYLVLASFFNQELWALRVAEAGLQKDDEDKSKDALAVFMGLHARLVSLAMDEDQDLAANEEEIIRDIAWSKYYLARLDPSENERPVPPEQREFSKIRSEVREDGAVILYRDADISLGRGAEFLNVSQGRFKKILSTYDIQPRTGPQTSDELWSDSGFENLE